MGLTPDPHGKPYFHLFGWVINYPLQEDQLGGPVARRLYNFPVGVLGVALATAAFPAFSRLAAQKDHQNLAAMCRSTLLPGHLRGAARRDRPGGSVQPGDQGPDRARAGSTRTIRPRRPMCCSSTPSASGPTAGVPIVVRRLQPQGHGHAAPRAVQDGDGGHFNERLFCGCPAFARASSDCPPASCRPPTLSSWAIF